MEEGEDAMTHALRAGNQWLLDCNVPNEPTGSGRFFSQLLALHPLHLVCQADKPASRNFAQNPSGLSC